MLVTILSLGLVAVAAATDIHRHKIYNWTTYPGILAGLAFHGIGSLLIALGVLDEAWLARWGWIPLGQSALGLAICGGVMLVCFVTLGGGGGDVKLIAMLGALLGVEQGITVMLWTFVLGGCLALIILIWRVGPWRLVTRVARQIVYSLRIRGWSPLTPDERAQLQPPLFLAPCAFLATLIVRFGLEQIMRI
jgi:prepilin peptidase CpaA